MKHRKQSPTNEQETTADAPPHHSNAGETLTTTEISYKASGNGICKLLIRVFDCLWTLILLLLIFILIITVLFPSIGTYLHGSIHTHAHQINRITRLVFISLHRPCLHYIGIDLTDQCLVQNPIVSEDNVCPCIKQQPRPYTVPFTQLPDILHSDPLGAYISRNAFPLHDDKQYGRETLLEYRATYGRIPDSCLVGDGGRGARGGPLRVQQLIEDSEWKKWSDLNSTWGLSWLECMEDENPLVPQLMSVIPSLAESASKHKVVLKPPQQYSISTQWSKSMSIMGPDNHVSDHMMALIVLQGTLRVSIRVEQRNCWEYCRSIDSGTLLYPGDALFYNMNHWSYIGVTWSNISFTMLTQIEQL